MSTILLMQYGYQIRARQKDITGDFCSSSVDEAFKFLLSQVPSPEEGFMLIVFSTGPRMAATLSDWKAGLVITPSDE